MNETTTLPFDAADVADALRDAVVLFSGTGRDANPHEIAELAKNVDGSFTLMVAFDELSDALICVLALVNERAPDLTHNVMASLHFQQVTSFAVETTFEGFALAE